MSKKPKAKKKCKHQVTEADVHEFVTAQAVRIDELAVAITRNHARLQELMHRLELSIVRQEQRVVTLRRDVFRYWNPIRTIQAHARLDAAESHLSKLKGLQNRIEKVADASLRDLVSQETENNGAPTK